MRSCDGATTIDVREDGAQWDGVTQIVPVTVIF